MDETFVFSTDGPVSCSVGTVTIGTPLAQPNNSLLTEEEKDWLRQMHIDPEE